MQGDTFRPSNRVSLACCRAAPARREGTHLLQVVVALAVFVELLLGAEADLADVTAEPSLVHLVGLGVRRQLVTIDEVTLVTHGADESIRVSGGQSEYCQQLSTSKENTTSNRAVTARMSTREFEEKKCYLVTIVI